MTNIPVGEAAQSAKRSTPSFPVKAARIRMNGAILKLARNAEGTPPYRTHHTVVFQFDIIPQAGPSTRLT